MQKCLNQITTPLARDTQVTARNLHAYHIFETHARQIACTSAQVRTPLLHSEAV